MKKSLIEELINKTEECLSRYWQHDYQYVLGYCSDDVVWIGATAEQFLQGIETVSEDFKNTDKELKCCHLSKQVFLSAGQDTKSCNICGKYLVTTDPDEDVFLQVEQRCTFRWKMIHGEPRIECIHISNPMGELHLQEGERFPNWLGKQSLKHLKKVMASSNRSKKIALTDKSGSTRFLNPDEIVYVKADDHEIIVYTLEGEVRYGIQYSAFLRSGGSNLVEVRRSYAVNPEYTKSIKNRELQMENGDIIVLPEKKAAKVRKLLKEYIEK